MSVRSILRVLGQVLALPLTVCTLQAQGLLPEGAEYSVVGTLPGDQVFPSVALGGSGGYAVWQDSSIDGKGFGIAARRLNSNLSGDVTARFLVNETTAWDQERPSVALFGDGSAVIVWQGGQSGSQKIFARFLNSAGLFVTGELPVGTVGKGDQLDAVVTVLADGNAVISWAAFGVDGDLQGISARIVDKAGHWVTDPFLVNQFHQYNQRNPAVAALSGGGFAITWVSEQQRILSTTSHSGASVDTYARVYSAAGEAQGDEFRVNSSDLMTGNPSVVGTADGGFAVAYTEASATPANGWDIVASYCSASGIRVGNSLVVNSHLKGSQIVPKIAALGERQLVVWTSRGQDGDGEGIYGQLLRSGAKIGDEFRVNTVTASRQIQPTVVAQGTDRFLAVWSSYVGRAGLDLRAQRYSFSASVPTPDAPLVSSLTPSSLQVVWPALEGFSLDHYEYRMNDGAPSSVDTTVVAIPNLTPLTSYTFRLRYVLRSGEQSLWSAVGTGITWGSDDNFDGLPDNWQQAYWGMDESLWPAGNLDSDHDGASNAQEFRAGTNPVDAGSVLRLTVNHKAGVDWLEWNTVPGLVYQVQGSKLMPPAWTDIGGLRLARGTSDSVVLPHFDRSGVFRVIRIR